MNLANTTSAAAYSWIVKAKLTKSLIPSRGRKLDVGCGWGRETRNFDEAVGVDLCLPYLKTARNYSRNEYVLADACHLPFRERSFESIVMSEVIEHLDDPEGALAEISRVLCHHGYLLIQTPDRSVTRFQPIHPTYGHKHEFTRNELVRFLERNGFLVRICTGSTIPYIPTTHRFHGLNFNKAFFCLWKVLNRLVTSTWDIIVLVISTR